MTIATSAKRFGRSLGIVAIFAVVGPLAATAVFVLFVSLIGAPLLNLIVDIVHMDALRNWLSMAIFLLAFFTLAATAPPSFVVGLVFAGAAVYGGLNSLGVAMAIAAAVVIGVVALGFFVSPSESSPLMLPSVQGLQQGAFLALFLSIPAGIAVLLSWLMSRPLHRT